MSIKTLSLLQSFLELDVMEILKNYDNQAQETLAPVYLLWEFHISEIFN